MTDEPMTTLEAALLAYSMDELEAMGPSLGQLLGARVARELETHPQPDVERMLELRRRMEITHFHPAIMAARARIAQPKLSEDLFWDTVRREYPEWLGSDVSYVRSERVVRWAENDDGSQTVVFETEETDDEESHQLAYGYRFTCVLVFQDGTGWSIKNYSVEDT